MTEKRWRRATSGDPAKAELVTWTWRRGEGTFASPRWPTGRGIAGAFTLTTMDGSFSEPKETPAEGNRDRVNKQASRIIVGWEREHGPAHTPIEGELFHKPYRTRRDGSAPENRKRVGFMPSPKKNRAHT